MAASATKRKRPAAKKAPASKTEAKPESNGTKEPGKREQERIRKAEEQAKVREAKIASGDLVIIGDVDFEKTGKDTKVLKRANDILAIVAQSKEPVVVKKVAEDLGCFYEDALPMFAILEAEGKVVRFQGKRRSVAYLAV